VEITRSLHGGRAGGGTECRWARLLRQPSTIAPTHPMGDDNQTRAVRPAAVPREQAFPPASWLGGRRSCGAAQQLACPAFVAALKELDVRLQISRWALAHGWPNRTLARSG